MANKYMNRYTNTNKMQIKVSHWGLAKLRNLNNTGCGAGCRGMGASDTANGGAVWESHSGKCFGRTPRN